MFKFEWDYQKATSNLQNHGVSFDEAVSVFADDQALTFADTDPFESEDRSRTYGMSSNDPPAEPGAFRRWPLKGAYSRRTKAVPSSSATCHTGA